MKLGIYMGSFNPPHNGHMAIINHLINNNYVDKILLVPTLGYWGKTDLIDIKHRIKMLKYFENDNIIVDTKHNKYIYTSELMHELEKEYLNVDFSIIMGADNIIHLDKWKNYQELLKYNIIIINRDNIDVLKYIKKYNGDFTIVNDLKPINISSTEIRKNLSSKYIDKSVLEYINSHNLYK